MKLKTFFVYISLATFLSACCNSKTDNNGTAQATSAPVNLVKPIEALDSNLIDPAIIGNLQDLGFVGSPDSNGTIVSEIAFKDTGNVGGAGSPNCSGKSICSYYALGTPFGLNYYPASAELVFSFNLKKLKKNQPEKAPYFEGKKTITFDSDWIIPEKDKQGLNIAGKAVVKAGIPFLIAHKGNTCAVILKVEK